MNKVYTFNELKESRLIYDRKPPAFGWIMTILTLVFIVIAFVWAGLSTKTYVITATGVVSDSTKTNIMNSVAGKIETIDKSEGEWVEEGEVILTLDSYQIQLQIAQIQSMVDLYERRIDGEQKLINFVMLYSFSDDTTQINPFSANDSEQIKLYGDAEYFIWYVKGQTDGYEEFSQSDLDDLKIQFLLQQSVYATIEEYTAQKVQYQSQVDMYTDSLAEYIIYAQTSGYLHLTSGLTVGTVLSSSTLIGNITSGNGENLYFSVAVSATERSKLSVGSSVEIAVSGAMQTEYGVLTGEIVAIDNDSTQTEDGTVYYVVNILPDETYLEDKFKNRVYLTIGMLGECRIKYDESTWLKWVAEQIIGKFN